MNYINILKNLDCWERRIGLRVSPLRGGMNNQNFLIQNGIKKYVAHFAPKIHKMFWLNREREIHNYKVISSRGFGADVFKYYKKHRLLIIEYLEGKVLTKKISKDPRIIKKIAIALRKLHSGPCFLGTISQKNRAIHYLRIVEKKNGWIPWYMKNMVGASKLVEAKMSPLKKLVPCHLDLMLENIILTQDNKIKFLDWEYSSNGDYRYDLAMLSAKGGYNRKQESILIKSYAGKFDPVLLKDIHIMKAVVCFAEAAYGVFQNTLSKRKDIDYRAYAISEFRKFEKIARSL